MARDATLRREPVLRASEPPVLRGADPAAFPAEPGLRDLLLTTTPAVEGRPVAAYLAVLTGEALVRAEVLADAPSAPRGVLGRLRARPAPERRSLTSAREAALSDLRARAAARGADAVVGVALATQVVGDSILLTATGTAVKLG